MNIDFTILKTRRSFFLAASTLLCLAPVVSAQALTAQDRVQVLHFRLHTNSLEPAQVRAPEGVYAIRVVNGAVMTDISVQLDDDKGARAGQAMVRRGGAKASFVARLKPGIHILTVPGRPSWRSQITVTPK